MPQELFLGDSSFSKRWAAVRIGDKVFITTYAPYPTQNRVPGRNAKYSGLAGRIGGDVWKDLYEDLLTVIRRCRERGWVVFIWGDCNSPVTASEVGGSDTTRLPFFQFIQTGRLVWMPEHQYRFTFVNGAVRSKLDHVMGTDSFIIR